MLIELLIAQLCSTASVGIDRNACVKAAEAFSIQYKIKSDASSGEKIIGDAVEKKVENLTGKDLLAALAFTAKIAHDKSLSTRIVKENGIIPSINATAGIGNGSVTLGWRF